MIFPAAFWFVVLGAARLTRARGGAGRMFQAIATGAAPAVAGAHLAKAVAKFSAWGGHLPRALEDPRGLDTMTALRSGELTAPDRWAPLAILGWVLLVVLLALALRAWLRTSNLTAEDRPAARAGLAITAIFFTAVLLVWGNAG